MENKNDMKHGDGCGCGKMDGCGCGGGCGGSDECGGRCGNGMHGTMGVWCGRGRHHHLVKWVIILLVLMFVFWAGVKIGELKGLVETGGYRMMMRRGSGYSGDLYPMSGMMGGSWGWDSGSSSSTPK